MSRFNTAGRALRSPLNPAYLPGKGMSAAGDIGYGLMPQASKLMDQAVDSPGVSQALSALGGAGGSAMGGAAGRGAAGLMDVLGMGAGSGVGTALGSGLTGALGSLLGPEGTAAGAALGGLAGSLGGAAGAAPLGEAMGQVGSQLGQAMGQQAGPALAKMGGRAGMAMGAEGMKMPGQIMTGNDTPAQDSAVRSSALMGSMPSMGPKSGSPFGVPSGGGNEGHPDIAGILKTMDRHEPLKHPDHLDELMEQSKFPAWEPDAPPWQQPEGMGWKEPQWDQRKLDAVRSAQPSVQRAGGNPTTPPGGSRPYAAPSPPPPGELRGSPDEEQDVDGFWAKRRLQYPGMAPSVRRGST